MGGSELLLTLLGAVALLLWGVRMVRTGLTRTFGATLRRCSRAPPATASRHSLPASASPASCRARPRRPCCWRRSPAASLVTLPIALAIMLGADVGTTLVAQVFAFDIKWLWAARSVCRRDPVQRRRQRPHPRAWAASAIGLGLMLLALSVLGQVSGHMRDSPVLKLVIAALGTEPIIAGWSAARC